MPRVSVIIPCYNQGRFLAESLDSVLRQTWQDFEIIVVDDGSDEEDTRRILAALERPRTTVLHTVNQGLAAARNNGIRACSGEYILPLDADDRIGPRYLEEAVAALDEQPGLGIVYCRAELFGAVEGPWALPDYSLEEMLVENCIFCTALFRRGDWEQVGGYDTGLVHGWEDYDFWLSLIERGRRVSCLPATHFYYRVSEDSMVRARPRRHKVESFSRIYRRHEGLFSEHIEVWIERLLEARQGGYHEAWLSGEGLARGAGNGRFVRKIEPGRRRLRFALAELGDLREVCFHPADDWALFRLIEARVEDGEPGAAEVILSPRQISTLAGCGLGRGASSCLVLHLPSPPSATAVLIIEIDYRALGRDCLAFLSSSPTPADPVAEPSPPVPDGPPVSLPQPPVQGRETGGKAMLKSLARRLRNVLRHEWRRLHGLWCCCRNAHFRGLVRSGLFDETFFLRANPVAHVSWQHPLAHYVRRGYREDINPHPLFDIAWYRAHTPGVGDGDPLLHYIERGWREGANPTALFFSSWYAARYPESTAPGWIPLRHYIERGWRAGCRPNPLFDPAFYIATTEEARIAGTEPLEHYIYTAQYRHLRRTCPLFDERFYLEDNPALEAAEGNVVLHMHYLQFGAAEGRSPNRLFDPVWYREQQGLDASDPLAPCLHFLDAGVRQGLRPWRLFDPAFYVKENPVAAADPLNHYLATGVHEGRYPCGEVASLSRKPVLSVLTPVYDTDPLLLRKCIQSVLYQAYPHWELCLVDDASPSPHVRAILDEFAARDSRIRVHQSPVNRGIAAATNEALAMATGEYLAFLDHDDELTLDALYDMVHAINDTDADFLYSDEDLVDLEGRYLERFAKPDWNPELLLCHNYITHLMVARTELVREVGGLAADTSGAQDYDLALKLSETARVIQHIPRALYRWRASDTSTSINHGQKDYADEAGRRALAAALARRGWDAAVEPGCWKFYYRVRRRFVLPDAVTVLTRAGGADPRARIRQLCQLSPGGNLRLFVLLSPDLPRELRREIAALDPRLDLRADPAPDCPARALNEAALEVGEGFLALLGEEVLPCSSDWLAALLEYAQLPEIGVVGGRMDGAVAGIREVNAVPRPADQHPRYWAEFFREASRHLNGIVCPQNVLALSADLCMVRAETFRRMNGFDFGAFPRLLFDADFCLRLREMGRSNVYTPHCRAERLAALAVPSAGAREREELERFRRRWRQLLSAGDPWYNPAGLWRNGQVSENEWRAWRLGRETTANPATDATS